MFFCPFCGSLLLLKPRHPANELCCSTCRYSSPIEDHGRPLTITHDMRQFNKAMPEDAIEPAAAAASSDAGGVKKEEATGAAEGGQIITTRCQSDKQDPPCTSDKAYYVQLQMRSADEPATTFFKCVACGFQWRQD